MKEVKTNEGMKISLKRQKKEIKDVKKQGGIKKRKRKESKDGRIRLSYLRSLCSH